MSERAKAATVTLKVPFHDCDPLFVVWHGRYLEYFELARTALLERHELDVPEIRALGYRMYVTDARCRYMFPLSYGDEVEVTASFTATRPLLRIAYDVRNLTRSRRSARGYTVLATTDAAGQLLPETPDAIFERL
jgi:acyl-CoA thioester hydrolase